MTDPVTLPQPECYEIDLVQGDEYLLSCFPVVVYGTHRLPVCDSRGHYAGGALWAAGDTVAALYLNEKFMLLYSVVDEVKLGVPSPVSSNAVAARCDELVQQLSPVNSVTSGNMHSVTSNAAYNATRKLPTTQIAWGSGSVQYFKISNLFGGSQSCNSYMMLARAGETILISIGANDGDTMALPKIKRLLNTYSKIAGFTYSRSNLYVAIGAWSHNVYIAQITGNINANIMVSVATASEYNAGTPITIET